MTTITSEEAADRLETAIVELENLQKHWSDLAWWERNMSLEVAFDLIFDIKDVPEYAKRCNLILDKAEELDCENMKTYPSDEALKNDPDMELLYAGNPRLPQGVCVDLMQSFSEDDIAELAEYVGVEADTPLDVLLTLNNSSLSTFYALRNRVGEMVKGQIRAAQA
jgi:hypothetical protein